MFDEPLMEKIWEPERGREHGAAGGGILHHDRYVDRIRDPRVELEDLRLGHPEGGTVVGRHHHYQRPRPCPARGGCVGGADGGAVVGGGDNHRHAAGHVFKSG